MCDRALLTPMVEKADKHWQMVRLAQGINAIPQTRFLEAVSNDRARTRVRGTFVDVFISYHKQFLSKAKYHAARDGQDRDDKAVYFSSVLHELGLLLLPMKELPLQRQK